MMTEIRALPATVSGLRKFDDVVPTKSDPGFSDDYRELFQLPDRMLKLGDQAVIVFRHEDVRHLSTIAAVSNMPAEVYLQGVHTGPAENPLSDAERSNIRKLQTDLFFTSRPPEHRLMKPIFAKAMSPKAVSQLRDCAAATAQRMLNQVANIGPIDFHHQFSEIYAREFWADVFEMTQEERSAFAGPCQRLLPIAVGALTREELLELDQAIPEYLRILGEAIRRVEKAREHAFLNELRERFDAVAHRGPGIPDSFEAMVAVNIIDGYHAVPAALSNTALTLLRNPDQYDALRAEPALLKGAVFEALRLRSPVPLTPRFLLEDIVYEGLHLPAGIALLMLWGASVRDPSIQSDASDFIADRPQKATTLFGGGPQICPGRNMARMMIEQAINVFLQPGVSLELAGEVEWREAFPLVPRMHPARIPVAITRGE